MTDSLFNVSMYVVRVQIWLLTFGFIVPFVWQLFYTESHSTRFKCSCLCLAISVFFFILELNQMREKGKKYVDLWNFVDIAVFIAFICYFRASLDLEAEMKKIYQGNSKVGANEQQKVEVSVIPRDADDKNLLPPDDLLYWCWMNTFILIFTSLKLMNFVRVHDKFGKMVHLVRQVLADAVTFTLFLAAWVFLFSLLN